MKSNSVAPLADTTPESINRGMTSLLSSGWITPATIFVLATLLRLYKLNAPSLWLDETHTWWLTRLPWKQLFQALREIGVHPPLYFALEKVFTELIGDKEIGLRMFSVSVDLVSLFVVMGIGRRVGGRKGLLLAGWFWAFHPMIIWYAREARPYSLAMLFSTATVYAYLVLQDRSSRAMWVLGFFSLALGMLTHYFVWLVGFILTLIALSDFKNKPEIFRRWALLFILTFIPVALWLIWYFQLPNPSLGIAWITQPKYQDICFTLWNLLSGFGGAFSVASTLFGILTVVLTVTACFTKEKKRLVRNFLLIGLFLPLLGIWLVSQRRSVYMDRYFSVLFPFMVLLVSIGGEQLWNRIRGYRQRLLNNALTTLFPLLALTIGLYAGLQIHHNRIYAKENWRALSEQLINAQAFKQPVWLSDPEAITALQYYLGERYVQLEQTKSAECQETCWWILRRPYTATHAFSSTVPSTTHIDEMKIPLGCSVDRHWKDGAGLELWNVSCEDL